MQSNPNRIFRWIDGIGDMDRGFLHVIDFEGGYERFVCQKDSSGLLYVMPNTTYDCDSLISKMEPIGIENLKQLNTEIFIELFPNPNNGNFKVCIKEKMAYWLKNNSTFIELYDILGNKILSQNLMDSITNIEHHFNPGIYFYRVLSGNIMLRQDKIVIAR